MTAKGVDVRTENTNNPTEINAASDTDTYKCKRTNRIGYVMANVESSTLAPNFQFGGKC